MSGQICLLTPPERPIAGSRSLAGPECLRLAAQTIVTLR